MLTRLSVGWKSGIWVQYCTGQNKFFVRKRKDQFRITRCVDENRECIGCYPRAILPFDPNKYTLTKVKEFNAMQFPEEDLVGYYLKEETIEKELKEYRESSEQFYYAQLVTSDLDTVRVFKLKEVS